MKISHRLVLFTTLFALSGAVLAQPTVDLIWSSASAVRAGSGSLGTNTINAQVGDLVYLDIVLTDDSCLGYQSASLSLRWKPDRLSVFAAEECPSPPNVAPGLCWDPANGDPMTPQVPGAFVGVPGFAFSFDALASDGGAGFTNCASPMTLGRVGFLVEGATQSLEVFYDPGIDAVVQGSTLADYYPTASATVLPPGC